MQQAAHGVVRIDAADALHGRARDRLAVGHDRERLEAGRREADRVGADVAGDERTGLRRGRQLDPIPHREQPDAHGSAGRPRGPRAARPPSRHRRRRSPRSRVATAASRRRTGAPRAPPRSARPGAGRSFDVRARSAARRGSTRSRAIDPRSCERLQRSRRAARPRRPRPRRPRRAPRRSCAGGDRPERLGLLDDDLAPLHQLEHREEGHGDHDTIMDAREQVLEHDRGALQRRAG